MKENKRPPISRSMTIDAIFAHYPEQGQRLAQEMTSAGLHCVGCQAATWETLEVGMLGHGFEEEAIDRLVVRLNEIVDKKVDPNTITLTQRAANHFKKILEQDSKQGWALRFSDKPGGCSGFEYVLDFSKEALTSDTVFTSYGVTIHVETSRLSRLLGCEIDYLEGLMGSGFKVINPNVKGSCSCGHSQSY